MDVGQAEIAALETVGQLGVVQTQLVKDRRLKIMHVNRVASDIVGIVVGFTVYRSWLNATPREPK